jgi:hypothetical protein
VAVVIRLLTVKTFPATLTPHVTMPSVVGPEFAQLREKIHNLNQEQSLVPDMQR